MSVGLELLLPELNTSALKYTLLIILKSYTNEYVLVIEKPRGVHYNYLADTIIHALHQKRERTFCLV